MRSGNNLANDLNKDTGPSGQVPQEEYQGRTTKQQKLGHGQAWRGMAVAILSCPKYM